jgi:CubicO group peptidase (beta-lactamase class C family)
MSAGLEANVDALIRQALGEQAAAGFVLRIEGRGQTPAIARTLLFEGAWGLAVDTPGRQLPMTCDTRFDIASLTKLWTTTAVLRLATLDHLSLDAPLLELPAASAIAEGHPLVAAAFRTITPRALLTHSSGLHYWYPFYAARKNAWGQTPRGIALAAPAPPPGFADILEEMLGRFPPVPGTVYSDINFMLLGMIVAGVQGASLPDAIHDLVTAPLGLTNTAYRPADGPFAATEFGNRIEKKMVTDLDLSFEGWRDENAAIEGDADDGNCFYFFGGAAGHAGLFSTVRDACRLGALYLGENPAADSAAVVTVRPFIDPALINEAACDHGGGRGLGFQLGELYPEGGFGHTGFTGTSLYLNRDRGLAIALFANRLHRPQPKNLNELRRTLAVAVLESLA